MTACTGSQYLAAVGAAKAIRRDSSEAIVYVESGGRRNERGRILRGTELGITGIPSCTICCSEQRTRHQYPPEDANGIICPAHRGRFGVHAMEIDGTSSPAVHEYRSAAIGIVRGGEGPVLIEAKVVRLEPHSSSDDHRKFRSQQELTEIAEADPILRLGRELVAAGQLTNTQIIDLRQRIKAEMEAAAD
ncbi:MAG TPA: thiamine pyrophosphate-dependent enzyme [Bryobacteraceae bacterium]|nr:thiamine pyrophosphate-dependent enzyme [Bryobacteraceae bacterium]